MGKFFCFNNNVSNLYNNSVVAKIYGMAYIFYTFNIEKANFFTLLILRKPTKIVVFVQLTKIKR